MTIDVTKGYDHALIHLDGGLIALHRSAQAREIADAFREAERHLEEVERDRAARLDRKAARATNHSFATTEPVGSVSAATTVTRHVVFASGEPCPCSCATVCGCGGAA